MILTVTVDDFATASPEGTIIVLTGTDVDTGDLVTFAGDFRPVHHLRKTLGGVLQVAARQAGFPASAVSISTLPKGGVTMPQSTPAALPSQTRAHCKRRTKI